MPLWPGLALIVIVWTSTQMALSSDGLNLAAVVRMVIGLSISLGMPRFYTAPLPGTSYKAMEVEADPLDPPPSSSGNGPSHVCGETETTRLLCVRWARRGFDLRAVGIAVGLVIGMGLS